MEPEELRKLRIAHGLTPGGLAAMLGTSSDVVLGWEASKRTPQHIPIEPETRRSVLRTLAVYRSRQKERTLIAAAGASARRFCLAVRACTRPALAISPGTERATEPAASQALRWIATGAPGRTRTGDLRFRKPPLYPTELPGRESTKIGEGEGNWWR